MAVLKETDGRGPFASLTMAVVIVKDVVVFVCFAINIEMANVVRTTSTCPASLTLACTPFLADLVAQESILGTRALLLG